MKKIRKSLEILSPEIMICIASFVVTFSLLLAGIHFFCEQPHQAVLAETQKVSAVTTAAKESPFMIQENIAKNIIRLHVIANSDTDADQQLKLKVRDAIITSLQKAIYQSSSVAEAKEVIQAHQEQIENTAKKTIENLGSSYTVKVSLCPRYFPVKQYGDLCFPAGTYDALCVEIGRAEGRNWWCVLFPSLCFVNETTATVPETSKEKLKECLSEEEYQSLSEEESQSPSEDETKKETKPELHFGILDWLKNL